MFKVTDEDIENLVNKEYENAVVEHGETYNSEHEFYAVLKEEVEEAKMYIDCIEYNLDNLWEAIKNNSHIETKVNHVEKYLEEAIKESLQCLAVIKKYKNKVQVPGNPNKLVIKPWEEYNNKNI